MDLNAARMNRNGTGMDQNGPELAGMDDIITNTLGKGHSCYRQQHMFTSIFSRICFRF